MRNSADKIPHELKIKLRDILIAHDVTAFRNFLEKNLPDLADHVVAKKDDDVSFMMHEYKSQLMYLGDDWQKSRNVVRAKTMYGTAEPCELLPKCAECKFFRTPPEGEESPCMHLGATPGDIACKGFLSADKTAHI